MHWQSPNTSARVPETTPGACFVGQFLRYSLVPPFSQHTRASLDRLHPMHLSPYSTQYLQHSNRRKSAVSGMRRCSRSSPGRSTFSTNAVHSRRSTGSAGGRLAFTAAAVNETVSATVLVCASVATTRPSSTSSAAARRACTRRARSLLNSSRRAGSIRCRSKVRRLSTPP